MRLKFITIFLFFSLLGMSNLFAALPGAAIPKKITIKETTTLRSVSFFAGELNLIGILNEGDEAEVITLDTRHRTGVAFQVKMLSGSQKGKVGWVFLHRDISKQRLEIYNENSDRIHIPSVGTPYKPYNQLPGSEKIPSSKILPGGPLQEALRKAEEARIAAAESEGVLNKEEKSIASTPQERVRENQDTEFNNYFKELEQTLDPIESGKSSFVSIPKSLSRILPEDTIWKEAIKGNMQVDLDRYKGGPYIPFVKEYTDSFGNKQRTTYWTRFKPKYLSQMPAKIQETVRGQYQHCRDGLGTRSNDEEAEVTNPGDWLKHCAVLSREDMSDYLYDEVAKCQQSIKDAITEGARDENGNLVREKVFKNMYSKLNKKEQEFAAMTITAFGEAGILAPPLEEMVMVMRVLSNRARYARDKGFEDANELDAALQSWQFSMYNKNDPNWGRAIEANSSNPHTINAIKAYILNQNTQISNEAAVSKIYHYHTDYVTPDWKVNSKIVKPELNGTKLKQSGRRHIFYKSIPWSFKHNKWSNK